MTNLEIIYEKIKKACLRRGFSMRTVETYQNAIKQFSKWYKNNTDIDDDRDLFFVRKSEITSYQDYLVSINSSQSTINTSRAALLFLLVQVYGRRLHITEKYSKVDKRMPEHLTQEEMKLFDAKVEKLNLKHRILLRMLYGAGLRVSELLNLKVSDFDLEHYNVFVRHGKGGKDRVTVLPESLVTDLKTFVLENDLSGNDFLFFQYKNKKQNLSVSTVSVLVKSVAKSAGITKNVHPHTLRHSFATHVVENGHPLWDLSRVMGHDSLETTMVYTHIGVNAVVNIKSPLDELNKL